MYQGLLFGSIVDHLGTKKPGDAGRETIGRGPLQRCTRPGHADQRVESMVPMDEEKRTTKPWPDPTPALPPFHPVRWLPGAHLQTIIPALWPAAPLRGGERLVVTVSPHAALRLDIMRASEPRGTLLLIHGLAGSSDSRYMLHTTRVALERRWNVVRMNLRNCGGTERLSRTLANAGQSGDVAATLTELEGAGFARPLAAIGFSLGGNVLLKYAGEQGAGCLAEAVVAVNPPIDLEASARALERPANRAYQAFYTRGLCRHLRTIKACRELPGPEPDARQHRSVRRLDELYIAPDGGYASAESYYAAASAGPFLPGVRVPTLVVSAVNDPFVPVEVFEPYHGVRPGTLHFAHPEHGGHVGYWQQGRPRFWAGQAALDFIGRNLGTDQQSA